MLMMIRDEPQAETAAEATRRIRDRLAAQISGALFALDPLNLADGKAGWTYDSAGAILAADVRTTDDLREYLESWGMLGALPTLAHLLGTFEKGQIPWRA